MPLMMNGERLGVRLNPPKAGEQTQEILIELGYSQDEIDGLLAGGIVKHAQTV
jgi:crotonobetainyl-CoA:carnitine CoA-transferase CaiB-like acyl-CoA transferase